MSKLSALQQYWKWWQIRSNCTLWMVTNWQLFLGSSCQKEKSWLLLDYYFLKTMKELTIAEEKVTGPGNQVTRKQPPGYSGANRGRNLNLNLNFLLVSSKVAKHNELRHLGRGSQDSVVREATESCPQRSQRGKSGARDRIIIKVLRFNFFLFSKPNLQLEFWRRT